VRSKFLIGLVTGAALVFLAFLLTTFVVGGFSVGRIPIRKPAMFAMCCIVVALSFWSLRVIE